MSSDDSDNISVKIIENNNDTEQDKIDKTSKDTVDSLQFEKQKLSECEEKLKHVLADFQNLSRKTQVDIENGIATKLSEFILDFLKIYDDFVRAKDALSENDVNAQGLNSILKNMDSLLKKYNVTPLDALGEIFDPNYHEAISIITDPDLDDNTITKEIRKGYISQKRVIRPTLVEISKKG